MTDQILPGTVIGRWTVQEPFLRTNRGERRLLCRCSCGQERYVLERSLKSGGSLSCGCLRKEETSKAKSQELAGMVFGDLTVLHKAEEQKKHGGIWWTCRCSCGSLCAYPATLLKTGKRTHCSDKIHKTGYSCKDITGKRFHRLTALCQTDRRTASGSVIWHCRCDCGREVDLSYNELVYTAVKSCGCRKKEHEQVLHTYLNHIDGTSLDNIMSRKLPANNTTGVRGVYLIRGKYVAKLVFQKKVYYLGAYATLKEAVRAREEAEAALYQTTIAFYSQWKQRAEADPVWAQENPIQIFVSRRNGNLDTTFLPVL